MVEQDDELPGREGESVVGGRDDAAVGLATQHPDAWIRRGCSLEDRPHMGCGGAIVDADEFPVAEPLLADARDHRLQRVGRRVVDGRDDRESGAHREPKRLATFRRVGT